MTNNDEQKKHNKSAKEILEKEKLIDPGNEHRHDPATEKGLNKENSAKHPTEPEGDAIDDGQKPE